MGVSFTVPERAGLGPPVDAGRAAVWTSHGPVGDGPRVPPQAGPHSGGGLWPVGHPAQSLGHHLDPHPEGEDHVQAVVRTQRAVKLCEMVGEHALFEAVGQIDHQRMLPEALDPVRAEGYLASTDWAGPQLSF